MKSLRLILVAMLFVSMISASCNNEEAPKTEPVAEKKEVKLKEENVSYSGDNITMNGFIVYDENAGPRPSVIIIHEWWGLNDYSRKRARQLAELGYTAFAIDLYGNGRTADNPDSAGKYVLPFYSDPNMTKARFDAALAKLKTFAAADTTQIAAIGYCFGGAQVLNMARMGENLKGVVSFHGNLLGVPLDKSKLKADMLICHGEADPFVPAAEVDKFRKEMDSTGARYIFKSYPGALHAFTNPEATALGTKFKLPIKYDAAADTASWNDMKSFFGQIFK